MKLRLSCTLLFLAVTALAAPAGALAANNGTVTVNYASSGPGQPDGYENASIQVQYVIANCEGYIAAILQQVPGSVSASQRYWFEGEQVPASSPPPDKPSVKFSGTVLHGGSEIGRVNYQVDGVVYKEFNCYTNSNMVVVGKISDHVGKNATGEQRKMFIDALTLRVDRSSDKPLVNEAIHSDVRAARAKAKKEAEEAEREKKKKAQQEEQAKKGKERKEAEEKEKQAKAEAEKKKQDYANGDFWGTGSKSASADTGATASASGAGRYVRTTDGGYWWQGADGKNRQVSAAEYNAARDRETETRRQAAAEETAKKNEETSQRFFADQQRRQEQRERTNKMIDTKAEGVSQSFYAFEAASNARDKISQATKLDRDYASVEQLDADIDRGRQAINQGFEDLEAAQQQQNEALQQMLWGGGSDTDQAVGNFFGAVAAQMARSENRAKKEQAKRELEERGKEMRRQIEIKQHAELVDKRRKLLALFRDGNMPLSSHKVTADTLYFFSYTFDKSTIENPNPQITLANTFPIAQYGDGTWPFKHSINSDLRKLAPGENTLMGYYTTGELADKAREDFLRLAKKLGFVFKDIKYAGRARSAGTMANKGGSAGSAPDFWGKPDAEKKPVKSDADFWK